MSGPPVPRPPTEGDNAIGSFVIGVSPIGSLPTLDWWNTVISQYANSPRLMQLVDNFFQYVDPTKNIDSFFDLIWNVDTAEGDGLDIWGRIVNVSRILKIPAGSYFGVIQAEDGDTITPYGDAPFFRGTIITDNYRLTDDTYRLLILAKALANISDGSIPSINQLLLNLFPHRGNCYVTDTTARPRFGFIQAVEPGSSLITPYSDAPFSNGFDAYSTMTMEYVFDFALTPPELAIVTSSGVLPKPTGVKATVVQNPP